MSILNSIIKAEGDVKELINEAKLDHKRILETSQKHANEEATKIVSDAKEEALKIQDDAKQKLLKNQKEHQEELTDLQTKTKAEAKKKVDQLVDFVVKKVLEV